MAAAGRRRGVYLDGEISRRRARAGALPPPARAMLTCRRGTGGLSVADRRCARAGRENVRRARLGRRGSRRPGTAERGPTFRCRPWSHATVSSVLGGRSRSPSVDRVWLRPVGYGACWKCNIETSSCCCAHGGANAPRPGSAASRRLPPDSGAYADGRRRYFTSRTHVTSRTHFTSGNPSIITSILTQPNPAYRIPNPVADDPLRLRDNRRTTSEGIAAQRGFHVDRVNPVGKGMRRATTAFVHGAV